MEYPHTCSLTALRFRAVQRNVPCGPTPSTQTAPAPFAPPVRPVPPVRQNTRAVSSMSLGFARPPSSPSPEMNAAPATSGVAPVAGRTAVGIDGTHRGGFQPGRPLILRASDEDSAGQGRPRGVVRMAQLERRCAGGGTSVGRADTI